MTYNDFRHKKKLSIVTSVQVYDFHRITDFQWLVEVSLPTIYRANCDMPYQDYMHCTSLVTSIEAWRCFEILSNNEK